MTNTFQIFGSASSKDYDIMVFVDKLGTIQENHDTVTALEIELSKIFTDKPLNANLAVIEDGKITKVFKGYPFEVNNSCFNTYDNHKQYHPKQVTSTYEVTEEIAHIKLKRCLRFILSFYSRVPEWRPDIKKAMKGTFDMRLEQARKIDFTKHTEFPRKNELVEDIYKVVAFQLAQTILLWRGIEIYSKEEAMRYFTYLAPFLKREAITEDDLRDLNALYKYLLMVCEMEIPKMKSLEEENFNKE